MSEVKRAIIMAAGLGNRMKPVTLDTPKPIHKTALFYNQQQHKFHLFRFDVKRL